MLVFFTNLSLLKFQVTYLALILLFSELDVKMDGSVLGEKSFFRMLGLTFSFELNWGSYIWAFHVKVSQRLIIQNSVLNNIFHFNMSI